MADQVGVKAADEAVDASGAIPWCGSELPSMGRVGCGGRRAAR